MHRGMTAGPMRWMFAAALCAVMAGQASGQQVTTEGPTAGTAKVLQYDVVSVRRTKGDPNQGELEIRPMDFRWRTFRWKSL